MKIKSLSIVLLASAMIMPIGTAQAQIFSGGNARTLLGAGIGAGLGGVLGSNLAGTNAQEEGTAIGAALGGLVGGAYANRSSSRYGNYGYGSRNGNGGLLGAGLGAVAGGVLGSNLAGTGVQEEGTAIGAVLGGLAGYGLGNRSNRGNRYNSGYQGGGFQNTGYQNTDFQGGGFQNGPGFYPAPAPNFGTFGGGYMHAPAPLPAPYSVPSGQFVSNTYAVPAVRPMTYQPPAPAYQAPAPQVQHVYHQAPTLPTIQNRVIHHTPAPVQRVHTTHVYQQSAPTTTHTSSNVYETVPAPAPAPVANYMPALQVLPTPQPSAIYCYSGSSKRYDQNGHLIRAKSCR